jgi:hypothetical protein
MSLLKGGVLRLRLVVDEGAGPQTVRVCDGTHGVNEMHRYTRAGGKQSAEIFDAGNVGEGLRGAMRQIETSYEAMITAWRQS